MSLPYRKKLIEVALPLEAINVASAREKSIRHGHPSTLHLWWSRKPLAACRAVLFAQLVDDPSSHPDKFRTEEAQEQERKRLFRIIENLVKWENSKNQSVLDAARAEILKSCDGDPPAVLDPFCGGGSIPLEAQRLGLKAYASDLNPVAVLITKALIEIPPQFAGKPPVNPEAHTKMIAGSFRGAQGLADDVRYYGKWMREEAEKRLRHLYPKVTVTREIATGREDLRGFIGRDLTVIAWLWARAVKCPNPACGVQMPLATKFWLSTKKGKQAWLSPHLVRETGQLKFEVKTGNPKSTDIEAIAAGCCLLRSDGKKVKSTFRCVACRQGIAKGQYIDDRAREGEMGVIPLAIVADGGRSRVFLPFDESQTEAALKRALSELSQNQVQQALPSEAAKGTFGSNAQGRIYGFRTFADYFTPRQLVTLTTFNELLRMVRDKIIADTAMEARSDHGSMPIDEVVQYGSAVCTYLGLGLSRLISTLCTLSRWTASREQTVTAFARQAIAMSWDYPEVNPFAGAAGDFGISLSSICEVLSTLMPAEDGTVEQGEAASRTAESERFVVCTDPPYYYNVSYADLSDFFYVWLRRFLGETYPALFSTLLTPKAEELVATPHAHRGKKEAKQFFERGLTAAFATLRKDQHKDYPLVVYYAFKQTESDEAEDEDGTLGLGIVSTGWETMLEGLLQSGFAITGTWPLRSELSNRPVANATNALASSVVLVCRPRPNDAPMATRREFLKALKDELPDALRKLQHGSIAPVDLAQAAIGPGMAVFSRYSKVLETDGSAMTVRAALGLINHALDEVLAEQEGEYDAETRWAVAWFEQFGMTEGKFGDAETLSKAKDTAINAMRDAGIVESKAGKVRLIGRDALDDDWDPTTERRLTIWQVTQYLVHAIEKGGEKPAAEMLRKLGALGESAKDLAYRLYVIAERKKWAQEAFAYNILVKSWPELTKQAAGPSGETARLL
ncbi:MAG: DUF1156 domain-containing protein [Candidatus Binatus sp.]